MRRAPLLLLLLPLAGCYVYTPVDATVARPGDRLRAYVTPETGAQIAGPLAPRISFVNGELAGRRADSLQLIVSYYRAENGAVINTEPTPISLVPQSLTKLEAYRFSGKRSILFGTAVGVGTVLLVQGIKAVFNLSTEPDTRVPPGGQN